MAANKSANGMNEEMCMHFFRLFVLHTDKKKEIGEWEQANEMSMSLEMSVTNDTLSSI